MSASRSRRPVRRTVLALATVVLLPVCYVLGVATLVTGLESGILPWSVTETFACRLYTWPAGWYFESNLPGAESFRVLIKWCEEAGEGLADK